MSSRAVGYYIAYALLVIGAFTALVLSQRPLSSTVVTMALFCFNLAAILFLMPQLLSLIGTLKNQPAANNEIVRLTRIIEQLTHKIDSLSTGGNISSTQSAPATNQNVSAATAAPIKNKVSLSSALISTSASASKNRAQERDSSEEIFRKPSVLPASMTSPEITHVPWPSSVSPAPVSHAQPAAASAANALKVAPLAAPAATAPAQLGLFVETSRSVLPASSALESFNNNNNNAPAANNFSESNNANDSIDANNYADANDAEDTTDDEIASNPQPVKLFATINVGEESVLCVRGEGAGLNWQEGIPLNYLGENRWSFESTSSTPITCRIYLNDEISAFGDDIVLNPGQTLELAPAFPVEA